MPNCVEFVHRERKVVVHPIEIDQDLCLFLGVPCDEYNYYHNWYSLIGPLAAVGRSFSQIREVYKDDLQLASVLCWLESEYITNSWYSP